MTQARIELTAVDRTKAAIDSANRNLRSLGDTVGALPARLGTLGVAIAATFSAVTVKGAVDMLDKLDDLSEKTGIAVESLSALRYAGEVVGTPLEAIATSARFLSKNMAEAAGGNKDAIATFKALNVEVKNADGTLRSQDDVLLQLADRFSGYEDGAAKAALAQKVFGKAGADMIPLLNQGSAGIRQLRSEAEQLGAVYGGELAKQSAAFNDNLKRLELNAEAAKVSILSGLMPALNKLIEGFLRMKREGLLGTIFKDAAKDVFGFGQLSDNPGADLQKFARDRDRIQRQRAFAERRGLPLGGFDSELAELDRLERVSRIRQEQGALAHGFDTSDALSRRLGRGGAGGRRAAPVVSDGDDAKRKAAEAAAKKALEEQTKRDLDALEEEAKIQAEINELLNDEQKLRAKQLTQGADLVAAIDFETAALGMTNLEREKAIALRELERSGIDKESEAYRRLAGDISAAVERREARRESKQFSDDLRTDVRGALQRAFEDSKNPAKAFVEALASTLYTRVSSRLSDAIMDAFFGKAPGGAAGGFLGPLLGGGGGLTAAFSQTSLGSSGFGTGLAYGNQDLGAFFHEGGVVGGKPTFSRRVSSSVWRGAPRFHTGGIAGDEVPIIAKRGEGIFTPEQMRALGGRGAQNITINMPVTVGDVVTGDRMRSEMQVLKRQMFAGLQRSRNYGGDA